MSNLPTLEELNSHAEFIVVQLDYNSDLIFPVDQGLEYIKSLRGCLLLKSEGYGDDKIEKVLRFDKEIKVRYITKEALQEMIVGQELLLRGGEDD